MRISDWSSDVCSSDLVVATDLMQAQLGAIEIQRRVDVGHPDHGVQVFHAGFPSSIRRSAGVWPAARDRKSVVSGKSVSVRVDLGGRRIIKNTRKKQYRTTINTQTK